MYIPGLWRATVDSPLWPEPCQGRPHRTPPHTFDRLHPGGLSAASCLAKNITLLNLLTGYFFSCKIDLWDCVVVFAGFISHLK